MKRNTTTCFLFSKIKALFFLAPFLGGALLAAHCTTTESGRKSFAIIPTAQMNALGEQAYAELAKTEKETSNSALKEEVTKIASLIATASGAKLNWEFKVFDSKQVNAFCLPGGKIGIYTALLPVAKTNAGLAAVIGHEVAHATLLHSNERMTQDILLRFGLEASELALSDNKLKTPIMAALGVGAQFGAVLPFGRFQETEADEIGLKYMAKAGFDPAEAAELWSRMAEASGGKSPPTWLSTHPNPRDRQENLRALAAKLGPQHEVRQKTANLLTP